MGHTLLYLGIAAISGLMMAIQGTINGALGREIGLAVTTFIVHATATIILIIILVFNQDKLKLELFKEVPWYLYVGGVLGIIITYSVALSIPRLGVAVATTAIITAQVLTAAGIDHLGLFGMEKVPFSYSELAGIIFLATGVKLLLN